MINLLDWKGVAMNKDYKYDYTICTEFNEDIFSMQCSALEENIPGIKKGLFLHDVNDTKIQFYSVDGNEIKIVNDFDVDAVYIDSDIELRQFFKN